MLSPPLNARAQWGLSGPTVFSQIINAAAAMAKEAGPKLTGGGGGGAGGAGKGGRGALRLKQAQ